LLTDGTGLLPNRSYYTAGKDFAASSPDALNAAIAVINDLEKWEKTNPAATAAAISPSIGLPPAVVEVWLKRSKYGVNKLTPEIFAGQQQIADTFFKLGLIPSQINVSAAAWNG